MTLGRGQRSNITKFPLPWQFQRFLYQILCVFSQMKDTIHIRWDFYSVAWFMPQGWDFGALGVPRGSNNFFFQTWSCSISNWRGWRAEQNACNIFILGSNWWPWGKRSNIINISISKIFHTKLCECSHKQKIENIMNRIFILLPRSCPGVGLQGAGGVKGFEMAPHRLCALVIF